MPPASGGPAVDSPTGRIRVEERLNLPAGTPTWFAIRPESITLHYQSSSAGDKENRIEGRIENLAYLGESATCCIRPEQGPPFLVKRSNRPGEELPEIGSLVSLSWSFTSGSRAN